MTQPTQHTDCNCGQLTALVAELSRRMDAFAHVVIAGYAERGLPVPAVFGPEAIAAAEAPQAKTPRRSPFICLPGGAA